MDFNGLFKRHYIFYIVAVYIFLASFGDIDFEYGFYQILRFISFFAFSIAAFISYKSQQQIMPFILGILAIVFNPFIPIHLEEESWQLVDIGASLLLILWSINFYDKELKNFLNPKKIVITILSILLLIAILYTFYELFTKKVEHRVANTDGLILDERHYYQDEYNNTNNPVTTSSDEDNSDFLTLIEERKKEIERDKILREAEEAVYNSYVSNLTTTDGLTIGETQEINIRRRELGLSPLDIEIGQKENYLQKGLSTRTKFEYIDSNVEPVDKETLKIENVPSTSVDESVPSNELEVNDEENRKILEEFSKN